MDISQSVNVYSPRPSSEDTFLSLCRSDAGPATCRRRARPILSVLYYNGIIFFFVKKKRFRYEIGAMGFIALLPSIRLFSGYVHRGGPGGCVRVCAQTLCANPTPYSQHQRDDLSQEHAGAGPRIRRLCQRRRDHGHRRL